MFKTLSTQTDKIRRFAKIVALTQRRGADIAKRARKHGRDPKHAQSIMTKWANEMLDILQVKVTAKGKVGSEPALFIGNHMSYIDIPLIMSQVPVVFVAKRELSKWPIFGEALTSAGTVFVDRDSVHSRKDAAEAIAPSIKEWGQSVGVFASGTTRLAEEKQWRWGAFSIAKRFDLLVQPFRLNYDPPRTAAFIGEDHFVPHLWNVLGSRLHATIEIHDPVIVDDPEQEAIRWWKWTRELTANNTVS